MRTKVLLELVHILNALLPAGGMINMLKHTLLERTCFTNIKHTSKLKDNDIHTC